jgi:hypothetical protein
MKAGGALAPVVIAALLAGCGDERRPSVGSRLEGPRSWQALARPPGEDLDLQPVLDGDLPADGLSVTVMAEGGAGVLGLGVRDPAGRWLVDPRQPERSPNRVLSGRSPVVAMFPSATSTLPLAAGYLAAPVQLSGSGGPVAMSSWIKRGPDGIQELPLAVLVLGPVVDDGALDIALGEVGRIWRQADIEVREPVHLRADGPAQLALDPSLGSDSPMLGQALALSARSPPDALTLVVVGDITVSGPGQAVWAVSGGVPVPPVNGTPRSGVAVSAVLLRRDPLWAGQIVAHEIGHALGLYHTTEASLEGGQPIHDTVQDTAGCPASADASGDATLSASECDAFDAGNLMFWATPRGATRLTAGQAALARRSARTR